MNEPIADTVRSIVDGHIVLDRELASRGQYPAINILSSISRLMSDIVDKEHMELAYEFRKILIDYSKIEDLVNLGAYEKGNNPVTDYALEMIDDINNFLKQETDMSLTMEESYRKMVQLLSRKQLKAA